MTESFQSMSLGTLSGKVALITGASKGIGKATAIRLAQDGALIVINYASDSTAANEVVKTIGSHRAIAVKADAGSISGIETMVDATVKHFGKIDILVPNAGILPMIDLKNTSEDDFDQIYKLNVKGPYFLVQKALPHMASGSHIVLLSSTITGASNVMPSYLLYSTTKGAVEQMVRVMSKDLMRQGICVNAVAPGPTATELFFKGKPEPMLKTIASFSPANRIGTPEEVADVVHFLSAEASRWMSGQVLRVNGGAV